MRFVTIHIYTTLAGQWGWTCENCRAESRYTYTERATALRHGKRHTSRCRKPRVLSESHS